MMSAPQIPLNFSFEGSYDRDDLIVGKSNQLAVEFFDNWTQWPGSLVILSGPSGSGKSHLVQSWAMGAQAQIMDADAIAMPLKSLANTPLAIDGLRSGEFDETALFHLINHHIQMGKPLVLTAQSSPLNWQVELPDLYSRLKAAQFITIDEPDDELLKHVLVKLFADCQQSPSPSVIDFLNLRMERSMAAAVDLVRKLDQYSLAQKKPITRPLVRDFLQQQPISHAV